MNKYDRFYDEACSEARGVINGWMNDKLRDELQGDDDSNDSRWHEDSDAFFEKFLSPQKSQQKLHSEKEINFYQDDEKKAVNQWMDNMHNKLETFTLSDYEKTVKKKSVGPKDPRLAMEARQQKVKEARARREEKAKKRLKHHIEKKQSDTIAREVIKQEALEKAQREKIEEDAVQREMVKIRKDMLELKKKHKVQSHVVPQPFAAEAQEKLIVNDRLFTAAPGKSFVHTAFGTTQESDVHQRQQLENVENFKLFQQQKVTRKYFNHWIKIVLSKRAAMGKGKALADWHIVLKTWSAWRKYYFEQVALKDAQKHEKNVKQMKVYDHVASMKHRRRTMKKCFDSWKKFVKMEQYSKDLLKEQEDTKKKMDALLGMVQSKAISNNNDLVLQTIEDESEPVIQTPVSLGRNMGGLQNNEKGVVKQSTPKHAWQVRRSDVQKLTLKQIENMSGDSDGTHDLTKVRKLKLEKLQGPNYGDRVKASKNVIAQQREMISQQKQLIEEQKRLLQEKLSTDDDCADIETCASVVPESTKVRSFQPPKRPKSLLAMEKRAEERIKRREELQERKRLADAERIEKQRQEQEEQKEREEEEKRRKHEELKRIRQLEIEKENERKAFVAKMQQLRRKADELYKRSLLRKYGLAPWLKFKKNVDGKLEVARFHFETTLSRNVLFSWFVFLKEDRERKDALAMQLYNNMLKRRCFNNWLKYGETMSILETKADLHYNRTLLFTYMRKWDRYVTDERLSYFEKEERANDHDTKRLKKRGFRILYVYKLNLKRQQLRSQRIADMRRKVTQLLPDFEPASSNDAF